MIAKNNIFNIRKGSGPKWQGETGANKGFVEFETRGHRAHGAGHLRRHLQV